MVEIEREIVKRNHKRKIKAELPAKLRENDVTERIIHALQQEALTIKQMTFMIFGVKPGQRHYDQHTRSIYRSVQRIRNEYDCRVLYDNQSRQHFLVLDGYLVAKNL